MSVYFAPVRRWFLGQDPVGGKAVADALEQMTARVSFGAGAPSGPAAEGAFYFDTTPTPYAGYVGHGGAWKAFS